MRPGSRKVRGQRESQNQKAKLFQVKQIKTSSIIIRIYLPPGIRKPGLLSVTIHLFIHLLFSQFSILFTCIVFPTITDTLQVSSQMSPTFRCRFRCSFGVLTSEAEGCFENLEDPFQGKSGGMLLALITSHYNNIYHSVKYPWPHRQLLKLQPRNMYMDVKRNDQWSNLHLFSISSFH